MPLSPTPIVSFAPPIARRSKNWLRRYGHRCDVVKNSHPNMNRSLRMGCQPTMVDGGGRCNDETHIPNPLTPNISNSFPSDPVVPNLRYHDVFDTETCRCQNVGSKYIPSQVSNGWIPSQFGLLRTSGPPTWSPLCSMHQRLWLG